MATKQRSQTERLAMYGGIAATIRAAMARKGIKSPAALNEALGRDRSYSGAYQWANGRAAPGRETRTKLARILGVPESALRRAELGDGAQAAPEPGAALVRLQAPASGRSADVVSFVVSADGTARLRLDYTAPAERVVALFRLLLDAGLVLSTAP